MGVADRVICAVNEAGALCAWRFNSSAELLFCASGNHSKATGSAVRRRSVAVDRRSQNVFVLFDNSLRSLSFLCTCCDID